jgi:RNA polymerase primary sigma factor
MSDDEGLSNPFRTMRNMADHRLLTAFEEKRLSKQSHGDHPIRAKRAKEELVKCNQRLVIQNAHRFKNMGLPLDDLVQEGNIGLIRAVEKFDPSRGLKLSTYATWWIRQRMQRAILDQSRVVRLPVHAHERGRLVRRAQSDLTQSLGREALTDEVAEHVGFDKEFVDFALSPEFTHLLSLDQAMDKEHSDHQDEDSFVSKIADKQCDDPCEHALEHNGFNIIMAAMRALSFRDREVLWRTSVEETRQSELADSQGVGREAKRQQRIRAACNLLDIIADTDGQRGAAMRAHVKTMGLQNAYLVRVQTAYPELPDENAPERTIGFFSSTSDYTTSRSMRAVVNQWDKRTRQTARAMKRVYVLRHFPSNELAKRTVVDSRGHLRQIKGDATIEAPEADTADSQAS